MWRQVGGDQGVVAAGSGVLVVGMADVLDGPLEVSRADQWLMRPYPANGPPTKDQKGLTAFRRSGP
jgi:hypothetical protein